MAVPAVLVVVKLIADPNRLKAYDLAIMGDTQRGKPLSKSRWVAANMPTLVLTGGKSEAFFHKTGDALAEVLPNAQHRILKDQHHGSADRKEALMLISFSLAIVAHLAAIAGEHGIVAFEADVLAENKSMLVVFAKAGLPMRKRKDGGTIHVNLSLPGAAA
jgi:hypothetical protein